MIRTRLFAAGLLLFGAALGYFAAPISNTPAWLNIPYHLGLDLAGGTHLVYGVDTSGVSVVDRAEALEGLRDVIERRVNLFGVSEPVVQIAGGVGKKRLIVELAGVFDIKEAIRLIGDTPFLEFRTEKIVEPSAETKDTGSAAEGTADNTDAGVIFEPTELTGRYLKRADIQFDQITGSPSVGLTFDKDGAKIFEKLTEKFINKRIAIYLDGAPISIPVVQQKISGGKAQITGNFTNEEARTLVRRLNSGALPLPIALLSQQSVEAALGREALARTFNAGLVGFLLVVIFMVLWYRLPGFVAVFALGVYIAIVLALFKTIPVTLSAAAVTGFILSIGMAVDANVLIFERMKEEIRAGKSIRGSVEEGFDRAWTSIRDSNISSLITAVILWWFGTSIVKGFALTLGIGVLISMFSAIIVSRTFLRSVVTKESKALKVLMQSGIYNG